ncbi:coiled-coil protein [Wolffia australiana]
MEIKGAGQGIGEVETMEEKDEVFLEILDALDSYVSAISSLTSSLRQGWLELSSARHSMGNSRISSTLFNLKPHSSATTVELHASSGTASPGTCPHFILIKWASHRDNETSISDQVTQISDEGEISAPNAPSCAVDSQIRKERTKALSMFGALVPPKLRLAQGSFETALEEIVEIANKRSIILAALRQLQTLDPGDQ